MPRNFIAGLHRHGRGGRSARGCVRGLGVVLAADNAASDVEQARVVAFRAHIDGMHFHEVAIRDPFEAEREYQALAKKIIDLLGPPEGVRVVEFP